MTDLQRLLDAARFAAGKHSGQKRKGEAGSPYVNHLIDVAATLADQGVTDVDVLAAAFLHDTIEDTGVTAAELEARFGAAVAGLVVEMSDDKALPKEARKQLQIEHAPHVSDRAKLIKLADKICNVREIGSNPPADWSLARRREYLDWSKRVVEGLRGVHSGLEASFDSAIEKARVKIA